MVSVLGSSVVDHRQIKSWSSQTKKCVFAVFFAKHTALRSKSKDWLARNHDNVSECSYISIHSVATSLSTVQLHVYPQCSYMPIHSVATCLSTVQLHVYPQTFVSVSQHYKDPINHVDLVQNGPHHHHFIECNLFSL